MWTFCRVSFDPHEVKLSRGLSVSAPSQTHPTDPHRLRCSIVSHLARVAIRSDLNVSVLNSHRSDCCQKPRTVDSLLTPEQSERAIPIITDTEEDSPARPYQAQKLNPPGRPKRFQNDNRMHPLQKLNFPAPPWHTNASKTHSQNSTLSALQAVRTIPQCAHPTKTQPSSSPGHQNETQTHQHPKLTPASPSAHQHVLQQGPKTHLLLPESTLQSTWPPTLPERILKCTHSTCWASFFGAEFFKT